MAKGKMFGATLLAGVLLLAACSEIDEAAEEPTATTTATEAGQEDPGDASAATATPSPTTQPPAVGTGEEVAMTDTIEPRGSLIGGNVGLSYPGDTYPSELSGIVGLAVSDLAGRLGVDEANINVVVVEEVTWSDASLGCPQPDMAYAQVVDDGLRIILESQGVLYDYRSGGTADPALCEQTAEKKDTAAGQYELTEDGEIVFVPGTDKETGVPTEGVNPPDE